MRKLFKDLYYTKGYGYEYDNQFDWMAKKSNPSKSILTNKTGELYRNEENDETLND